MGAYLFQGDDVYAMVDGGVDRMPWDAFAPSPFARDAQAHVLIAAGDGAALMAQVRRVRGVFPRRGIRTLVPYAAALRVALERRGILAAGESALVADDLGERILLTVLSGPHAAHTRAILIREPARVVEEIRRTQKSALEGAAPLHREPVFRILSNNAAVIEALDPERRKDAATFEGSFPGFDALGQVKFSYQLMTPEDAARQKRAVMRRRMAMAVLAGSVLAMAGLGVLAHARAVADDRHRRLVALGEEDAELGRRVMALSVATYQARLEQLPRAGFADVFERICAGIPGDARLERVRWQRRGDLGWDAVADIVFMGKKITPFLDDGSLKQARVDHMLVTDDPGMRISLDLTDEERRP